MSRVDRAVGLVRALDAARTEVARLEAEVDEMLGGGSAEPEPSKPSPRPAPPAATNGHRSGHGRKPDPIRDQIVALAKEGMGRNDIAEKLGLKGRAGQVQVGNHIYRARQAGALPKAGASR